jgi:hypothetical protein
MTRILIDGLAILALALSMLAAPPARADGGGELFGLLLGIGTVYAIGKGIEQARAPAPEPLAAAETRNPAFGRGWDRNALPRDCLATFQTWHGELRGFERACLARNMRGSGRLPRMCAIDTWLGDREATIYSARCLQLEGWEIGRRSDAVWRGAPDWSDRWRRP